MKRVFIIHGWDFTPRSNWYPWLKKELEAKGYDVTVPIMPHTSEPKIRSWVEKLEKIVGELDEETYFIGHSIGCQTIMRYLEKSQFKGKIPKVVFVAGWFNLAELEDPESEKIAAPWLSTPIDCDKVRSKIDDLVVFLSDNEPYGFVEDNAKDFRERLGASVFILKERGHFTKEDGVVKIKELLNEF